MRRPAAALIVFLGSAHALSAQADTIPRTNLFTWRDAAIVEGFAILAVAAAPLDRRMALRLRDSTLQENRRLRRTAEFVRTVADPGAFIIGGAMFAYGRLADDDKAADLGLHGTEALLVGQTIGVVLKGIVGRGRPFKNIDNPHDYQLMRGFRGDPANRSMPSGHTIAAFAAASAVTSETNRWWPGTTWIVAPVMYGGASVVGLSRMYNNKHWATDVITGAAIGTMAGLAVVRWHFSHPGNKIDRYFLGASIRPTSTGWNAIALQFAPMP